MQAALRAIAAPHRRQILRLVWDRELSAGEIAGHFDVTRRLYRARPEGLADLKALRDEFWGDRLEALKHEVESREGSADAERG